MQAIQYNVDIVLCIDSTGSMGGIIEKAKTAALNFHEDLLAAMKEKDKNIDNLRIRVISYRDYFVDGDKSMVQSPFYKLPEETEGFSNFVKSCSPEGGGDEPESGMEALALAFKSDWSTGGDKRRQIIIIWTDASCHPLEKGVKDRPSHYPEDIPKSFDELTDFWEDGQGALSMGAKRLILYTPDAYPWTDISTHWSNTVHYPSKAGEGLEEIDYKEILEAIANSV